MPETFQLKLIWLFTLRCEGLTERMSRDELMYGLDCDETFLEQLRATFLAKGFIDKDWTVKHWNQRQYVSDSSTPRVHKHREQQALKQVETLQKPLHETHQNRTEQNRTEKKPSRRQAASDGMKHSSDPRHLACKEEIFTAYRSKNGVDPPWDGREGKALGMLLNAWPKVGPEGIRKLLRHWSASDIVHGDRPGIWIPKLSSFMNGPIDRFNKPVEGNGNGNQNQNSRSVANGSNQPRVKTGSAYFDSLLEPIGEGD